MSDAAGAGGPGGTGGPDGPEDRGSRRFLADVLTFGWVLPASIAAGAGLGWILDKAFGVFPVLTAALGLLGLVAGLRQIYRESEVLSGGKGEDPPDGRS
jgi:F0F1-type ATP synthase assembly protein I